MEESIKDPGAKLSIAPNAQHTYTSCTSMHSKHAHTHPYSHSKHVPYAHHINMYTAYTPYTHHIHAYISYTEHTLYTCYTHFSIIYMHIQRTLCIHTILIHCNPYMRHIFKYHTTHIYIYHLHTTHIYHLHIKTAHTQHTLHIYVTYNKRAYTSKTCTYVQITHTLILP